ncbi:F-box only protein 9-like [Clytia hemisphaerica]|uniref:F-box only protein 9 n=1 Tax=Clytia hemisphaerica TaxID=252671 RepID=A0A7M5UW29_9CNID
MERENVLSEELASFRQEWAEELYDNENENVIKIQDEEQLQEISTEEEKAVEMFIKATKLEKEGNFNAAVVFYREAIKLFPDVEFKVADYQRKQQETIEADEKEEEETQQNQSLENFNFEELTKQLALMHVTGLCSPNLPQTTTHISALPSELLVNIIRWVVSKELDMKSLSQFSLACKWFYICARDEELWKIICLRTWGMKCCAPKKYQNSWQRMFVERPHLRFDGVYISENTYVRAGEQSVDSFYKPFHLVVYYKYLRFFSDGRCIILTSADELKPTIQSLKSPPYRDPHIYVGYYRMTGEKTVNIFYSYSTKPNKWEIQHKKRKNQNFVVKNTCEHNFFMQLELQNTKKSKNNKLQWVDFICKTKNNLHDTTSENTIEWQGYKPFIFSRVKSYTSSTDSYLSLY